LSLVSPSLTSPLCAHRIPIGINLKKNIGNEVARARDSTYIFFTGSTWY
jgi:hypothetical protein